MPTGKPQSRTMFKENRQHGTFTFPCALYQANRSLYPDDRPFMVKHHWHEEIELIHIKNGAFQVEIDMQAYASHKECFLFINSGQLHSLSITEDYRESALVFSPSVISFDSPDDFAQARLIRPLIAHELLLPMYVEEGQPAFEEIRQEYSRICSVFSRGVRDRELWEHLEAKEMTSQIRIKAALLNIMACLDEHQLLGHTAPVYNQRIETLKTVITYIQENYREKIYNSQLAGLVNMNEQYFCRFFKKNLGKTPVAYINELRIHQAATLLRESDQSVMDICMECGFFNLGHFMNEFKKATGLTPLQFRKKNTENNF